MKEINIGGWPHDAEMRDCERCSKKCRSSVEFVYEEKILCAQVCKECVNDFIQENRAKIGDCIQIKFLPENNSFASI